MEHFRHFGDIVVKLMDTTKKTTYHHAMNVGSTVYIRLFLANNMNLMRQICFLLVREERIFMEKAIHETMPDNHAMEENVHHGMYFILHLNFVRQLTIQPTMIKGLVPHCLLMEGSLISQFREQNECCEETTKFCQIEPSGTVSCG